MLRVQTQIIIKQAIPYVDNAGITHARSSTLNFDFCHSYETEDSWDDLTNKGNVILPKSIYVRDENGKLYPLGTFLGGPVSNVNIGGFSTGTPLLLKGDQVSISAGYKFFNANGEEAVKMPLIFTGYISRVTSKKPLQFEVEDNMWKLKQIQAPIKTFPAGTSLEAILTALLKGSPFIVNALTDTSFGEFVTGNETVAEVLARLRRLYHFESYFRGNELRSGAAVYIESEAVTSIFEFQNNIISDELEYRRRDDIVLSAVARNNITEDVEGKMTRDGKQKTKNTRLEVLVTLKPDGSVTQYVKTKDNNYPPNTDGERRDLPFPGAKTIADLVKLATAELTKYYYTGFKGSFTTFGLPLVKQGDNVQLIDDILPERNGLYKVKKVKYKGGVGGLRQEIFLDYLVRQSQ